MRQIDLDGNEVMRVGQGLKSRRARGNRKGYVMGSKHPMDGRWPAVWLAAIASCLTGQSALAQQTPQAQRGLTILRVNCERCHAIDMTSNSPLAIAPAFRTLHLKYPIESLERPLTEGIIAGHPTMPQFRFERDQVVDILAYLKTLER
jgi:cytochrome c